MCPPSKKMTWSLAQLTLLLVYLPPLTTSLPLRVVVKESSGFVDVSTLPNGQVIYSGLAIEVFERALQEITTLNASAPSYRPQDIKYYQVGDNQYGAFNGTGWTGMIGDLVSGKADVAVGDINELLARTKVVTFTGSWLDAPLAFLVSPVIPKSSASVWGWLRPFSPNVWLVLVGFTCLFALSLAWLEKLSPFSFRNLPPLRGKEEYRQRTNMKESWHRAVNNLLGQGPWAIDLSSHSSRVLYWGMAFLSLFTVTFYTSSLTTLLSAPLPFTPINSLADIQGGGIPFCVTLGSSAQAFIDSPLNSVAIRKMAAYMQTSPDLPGCLVKLLDPEDPVRAVMAEAPILTYVSSSPPYCGPQVVGTLPAQGYYSFPVRTGHPIAPLLTDAMLSMMETLALGTLVSGYLGEVGSCVSGSGAVDGGEGTASATEAGITVEDLSGVFFTTLILVVMSYAVLGLEILSWRMKDRRDGVGRRLYKFCGGHYYVGSYREEEEGEGYVEDWEGGGKKKGEKGGGSGSGGGEAVSSSPKTSGKGDKGGVVINTNPLNLQEQQRGGGGGGGANVLSW